MGKSIHAEFEHYRNINDYIPPTLEHLSVSPPQHLIDAQILPNTHPNYLDMTISATQQKIDNVELDIPDSYSYDVVYKWGIRLLITAPDFYFAGIHIPTT